MQTTQQLRRKIDNAQDLLSVVKTMKSLAAVNIRHYEQAVDSLASYNRTVELGLHALMRSEAGRQLTSHEPGDPRWAAIVLGSDQGFCGQFNERIVAYADEELQRLGATVGRKRRPPVAPVGLRCAVLLEDTNYTPTILLETPSGLSAVTTLVQDLLVQIDRWQSEQGISHLLVFHNRPTGGSVYESTHTQLLPLNGEWLQGLKKKPWPGRSVPLFTMEWQQLFSSLIRQYMFVVLYRATTESLAAEETARLASMQNAEKNIDERIEALTKHYHQQRGDAITAELMDIVAGFEAVMGSGKRRS
jgi:F-type H+-transporting ATPase subunit gamma